MSHRKSTKRYERRMNGFKRRRNQLVSSATGEINRMAKLLKVPVSFVEKAVSQAGGDVTQAFKTLTNFQAKNLSKTFSLPITMTTKVLQQTGGDVSSAIRTILKEV